MIKNPNWQERTSSPIYKIVVFLMCALSRVIFKHPLHKMSISTFVPLIIVANLKGHLMYYQLMYLLMFSIYFCAHVFFFLNFVLKLYSDCT